MVSPPRSAKAAQGYALITLVSILFGSMGILQKWSYAYGILPDTLIALRLLISSTTLFLLLALFRRGSLKVQRSDVPSLLILGVFGVAFQRVAYAYAVYLTTATMAAILFYTYPVFVTILAALTLKEKITYRAFFAIVLAFVGVALVVRAYDPTALSIDLLGVFFGLGSSGCFVLYFMLTQRLRTRHAAWTLTAYGDGVGALSLSPFVYVSLPQMAYYPWQLWVLIFTIAWILSLLAYVVYSYALKEVKASKGSILSVLEPLSAAIYSALLLGETLQALQVVGIVLALTGVVLLFHLGKRI
jgi:drug/metabolite transporter (DMT)-like permease